jgi:hypothetical protein
MRWFTFSFRYIFTTSCGAEFENMLSVSESKHSSISQKTFTKHETCHNWVQHIIFMGCIDLCITYFKQFTLMLSVNFMSVRVFFLHKYGSMYVRVTCIYSISVKAGSLHWKLSGDFSIGLSHSGVTLSPNSNCLFS